MKRANGLAFISLIALIGSAQAQSASSTASNAASFTPSQYVGMVLAVGVGFALIREFLPARRRKS